MPNVYGTEVFLTCSLHDAQDVIIFQVSIKEFDLFQIITVTIMKVVLVLHCPPLFADQTEG